MKQITSCIPPDTDWREGVKHQEQKQQEALTEQKERHQEADEVLEKVLEPETQEA